MAFKILASTIQATLSKLFESDFEDITVWLQTKPRYLTALFILRRAMEWANMTQRPLNVLFFH